MNRRFFSRSAAKDQGRATPDPIRAKNRRRFLPRTEGLEVRELLSVAPGQALADTAPPVAAEVVSAETAVDEQVVLSATSTSTEGTATPRPQAVGTLNALAASPLRNLKIERLPALLNSVQRGRIIPPVIVATLQEDLRALEGKLAPPPSSSLAAFNRQLRNTLGSKSLGLDDAKALNHLFGKVLDRAGAPPEVVERFQAHMNELTRVNVHNRTPALVTANDYALLLQTSLGVGIDFEVFHTRPTRATPQAASNAILHPGTS